MDQLRIIALLTRKCVRVIARKRSNRTLALLSSMMIFGTLFGMQYLSEDRQMHFLTSERYDELAFHMTCMSAEDADPFRVVSVDKTKGVVKDKGKDKGNSEGSSRSKGKSKSKGKGKAHTDKGVDVSVGVGVKRTLQCRPDDTVPDSASKGLTPTDVLFNSLGTGVLADPSEAMRFTCTCIKTPFIRYMCIKTPCLYGTSVLNPLNVYSPHSSALQRAHERPAPPGPGRLRAPRRYEYTV
jgi:hypothetical protein